MKAEVLPALFSATFPASSPVSMVPGTREVLSKCSLIDEDLMNAYGVLLLL